MSQLVRWEPLMRDFSSLANRFNQMLGVSDNGDGESLAHWYPAVDIADTGEAIVLHAELPGMKKDQFDIRVEDNTLVLSGQRERTEETQDGGVFRAERSFGRFHRSFSLPSVVEASKISATYRNGVLEVTLPKAKQARPRQIDVKVA